MKPHGYWTTKTLQEAALCYNTRGEFLYKNPSAYNIARRNGILNKICSHMKPAQTAAYTYNELKNIAALYNTRQEFAKGNNSAYVVAHRRGILNKICKHMKPPKTKLIPMHLIISESKKFNDREIFKKENPRIYNAAVKRNILQQITSHMKKAKNSSNPEIELFDIIKVYFPTTKKLIKRNIKIKRRPYIYGFHIDIYIPELKLGIEFNGTYYHSFDGLKRCRPHWPDSAIRNYHDIKDKYFLSEGIKILHIKEVDWIKDKQTCINECLEFLGIK